MTKQETDFVARLLRGDKTAQKQLVDLYKDKILYLAYDLVGNYEDAKDVAQEIFYKIFKNIEMFERRSKLSTWIYKIGINQCHDFINKRNRNMKKLKNYGQEDNQNGQESVIEQKFESAHLNFELQKAIKKLSQNQMTAIVLKYFHEKSTDEIAEIMNCSVSTVRTHIFRGLTGMKMDLGLKEDF